MSGEITTSINAREKAARQSESIAMAGNVFDSLGGNDMTLSSEGAQTIHFGKDAAVGINWPDKIVTFQGAGLSVEVANVSKIMPKSNSIEVATFDSQTTFFIQKEGQIMLDSRDRREVKIEMENTESLLVESGGYDSVHQDGIISSKSNTENRESTFTLGESGIVRFESHLVSEPIESQAPENIIFAAFGAQEEDENAA